VAYREKSMNARALIAIASAFVSLQSMAAVVTLYCRAKVVEATGTEYKVGGAFGDTFVFDEADNSLSVPRGQVLKAQATSGAIAAKATPRPGVVMTLSIWRATGGYVTTHTEPGSSMKAEGKCEETIGDIRKAGGGSVTGSVYANPFFGMTIRAPAGWRALGDKETRQNSSSATAENVPVMMMIGPSAGRKAPATVALLIDERRRNMTLDALVGILRKGSGPEGTLTPVREEPLGGRAYSSYRWSGRKDGKEMWMQFYARFEKGHSLVFVATGETEDSLLEAERVLRDMQRK
jgi:hypothetical protein